MWVYMIKALCPRRKWRNLGKDRRTSPLASQCQLSLLRLRRREVILKESKQKVLERYGWLVLAGPVSGEWHISPCPFLRQLHLGMGFSPGPQPKPPDLLPLFIGSQ